MTVTSGSRGVKRAQGIGRGQQEMGKGVKSGELWPGQGVGGANVSRAHQAGWPKSAEFKRNPKR